MVGSVENTLLLTFGRMRLGEHHLQQRYITAHFLQWICIIEHDDSVVPPFHGILGTNVFVISNASEHRFEEIVWGTGVCFDDSTLPPRWHYSGTKGMGVDVDSVSSRKQAKQTPQHR
jgi:hypothetical protein